MGASKLQFVLVPIRGAEAEGVGEGLGAFEVGLLEFQPGEVEDLDDGIPVSAGVFAGQCAEFAVDSRVCVAMAVHP